MSKQRPFAGILLLAAVWLSAAGKPEDKSRFLADGEEKPVVVKRCATCHATGVFTKFRKSEEDWEKVMADMATRGAQVPDTDYDPIVDYLARNYGPESKLRINRAPVEETGKLLDISKDEAAAIISYRESHGAFKDFADLLKVPGIDAKKLEAKRELLEF